MRGLPSGIPPDRERPQAHAQAAQAGDGSMSVVVSYIEFGGTGIPTLHGTSLIACNHCGIVALNTPAFGWRRFYDDDGELTHHCAAKVEQNSWIAQCLVSGMSPDEAIVYEDPDRWVAEVVGVHDD